MTPYQCGESGSAEWTLCLYVAGQSPRSIRAFSNLTALCECTVPGRYDIEVIDLAVEPSLARRDDIVAIPTLIRRTPAPPLRIIGDLSDRARVMACLELTEGVDPWRP